MSRRQKTVHLASYISWSREGTETYQTQRLRWVERLDNLIRTLKKRGKYSAPILCDQTLPLTDYLEIRPQYRATLTELVRQGALEVGPWYVQPLEELVGAEALLRNLALGERAASDFGVRLDVAYLAPTSTHISQMPQILRGFGIQTAVVPNGLAQDPGDLWWEARDGSRVLLVHSQLFPPELISSHTDSDTLESLLAAAADDLKTRSTDIETLILVRDFETNTPLVGDLIPRLQQRHAARLLHSGLYDYALHLWEKVPARGITQGDLFSTEGTPFSPGFLTTRIWLKQRNYDAETLLTRWAEPFTAWADEVNRRESSEGVRGSARLADPAQLLDHAWSILLRNHAPTAVSGAAIDATQSEIELRFDQASEVGEFIARQNLEYLAHLIDTRSLESGEFISALAVFNAAGQTRSDIVEWEVELPADQRDIEVVDSDGRVVPADTVSAHSMHDNNDGPKTRTVRWVAKDLAPFGYRAFALRAARSSPPTPALEDGGEIANDYFSVEVDPADGTLMIFDKRTGRSFSGLNRYIDSGDRGDAYLYCAPDRDTLIDVATNTPLRPQRLVGSTEQSLQVFQIFRLPQALNNQRDARLPLAAQFVPISVWTNIRLARGIPRVDIEVIVANAARDHLLQVSFPTGIMTNEAFYDGHFHIERHSVASPNAEAPSGWTPQPSGEKAHRGFVSIIGDDSGLTLATRGLPQVQIVATQHGCEILLALLRSVGWLNRDDVPNHKGSLGEMVEIPGAQGIGEHRFSYSLIPHGRDPLPAWQQAWSFQVPARVVETGLQNGPLPLTASLVSSENPRFIVSAIKSAQDNSGVMVRGYSISDHPETVRLQLGVPFRRAEVSRLDEGSTDIQLKIDRKKRLSFDAQPGEIVTIRLTS